MQYRGWGTRALLILWHSAKKCRTCVTGGGAPGAREGRRGRGRGAGGGGGAPGAREGRLGRGRGAGGEGGAPGAREGRLGRGRGVHRAKDALVERPAAREAPAQRPPIPRFVTGGLAKEDPRHPEPPVLPAVAPGRGGRGDQAIA